MSMRIEDKVISDVKGRGIPKPGTDQDTDRIIPARYLKEITFKRMGEYVFIDERLRDGVPVEGHPFNDPKYKGAKILVAGSNFGCGSSREHAPQALQRWGIDAIIAPSYAEIFAGNCAAIGLVAVTTSEEDARNLVAFLMENPDSYVTINLEGKTIAYGSEIRKLDLPEGRRQSFLNGSWDRMAVLQQNDKGIRKVEEQLPYLKF